MSHVEARARIEPLDGSMDQRAGLRYEVHAPDGYQFDTGEHSRLARSVQAARLEAEGPFERCEVDCPCGEGA